MRALPAISNRHVAKQYADVPSLRRVGAIKIEEFQKIMSRKHEGLKGVGKNCGLGVGSGMVWFGQV